jgi:hypothetical protein
MLSVTVTIAGATVAGASVIARKPHKPPKATILCKPYDRRTVKSSGIAYIVRNDVFSPERECLRVHRRGVGFTVVRSGADSHVGDTDAFPEVVYGCAFGLCSPGSVLPRRVYRFSQLDTSWSTSWRQAPGHFDVAYDLWFGRLRTINGHVKGAELMIWLGTKRFGTPFGDPIVTIDGQRWYYARHKACNDVGCWNFVLFRRVVPTTHVHRLKLLPFIHAAEQHGQISYRWFLKSIDGGFEIWNQGRGLAVHSYEVRVKLRKAKHKKHKKH